MSAAYSIPEARADDDEDVRWALSTATALLTRGDPQEALKWLRRAAEAASDANRDARSLELYKSAGDFASSLREAGLPTTAPPPPVAISQPPSAGSNVTGASQPPPRSTPTPPPARMVSSPPPIPSQRPAGRSTPPPPPRARQASIPELPSDRPSLIAAATRIAADVVEPMASTVPGPVGPTTKPDAASGRLAAKTLASNMTYDATKRASQPPTSVPPPVATDAVRIVEKTEARIIGSDRRTSTSTSSATSRPEHASVTSSSSNRASRPTLAGGGGRSSHVPQAPLARGRIPPEAAPTVPGSMARPAATGTAASSAASTADDRAPLSRGRRLGGRRPTTKVEGGARKEDLEKSSTDLPAVSRYEDEVTAVHDFSRARSSIQDLEENTNVLSGLETDFEVDGHLDTSTPLNGVPIATIEAQQAFDSAGEVGPEATDPDQERVAVGSVADRGDVTSMEAPILGPRATTVEGVGMSAFRIAFSADVGPRGKLDVVALAPGEPAPSGRIAAIVVPTDVSSSAALAELFARLRGADSSRRR